MNRNATSLFAPNIYPKKNEMNFTDLATATAATNFLFAVAYCLLLVSALVLSIVAFAMFMIAKLFLALANEIEAKNKEATTPITENITDYSVYRENQPQTQDQNAEEAQHQEIIQFHLEIEPLNTEIEQYHQEINQTEQEIMMSTTELDSTNLETDSANELPLSAIERHLYLVKPQTETWKQLILDDLKHQTLQVAQATFLADAIKPLPKEVPTPTETTTKIEDTNNNTNLIEFIKSQKAKGKSLKKIADLLNKSPEFSQSGKWYPAKITKILKTA